MPSVISRCAAVAVRLLRVTVQLVLPCPPHPTCCAVGVGGAVTDAVILVIVPRPLWSLFPRLNGPDDPGLAGTGFWPGAALPPLFEQVYVATPVTVRLAIAGVFPSPLKLPPVRVTDAPLKVVVGSDFTVTAASAIEDVTAKASSAVTISHRDFLIMVPFGRDRRFGASTGSAPALRQHGCRGGADNACRPEDAEVTVRAAESTSSTLGKSPSVASYPVISHKNATKLACIRAPAARARSAPTGTRAQQGKPEPMRLDSFRLALVGHRLPRQKRQELGKSHLSPRSFL